MLMQLPAVVLALMTWLNEPPTSLADAAQREAVRRALVGQSTRSLTTSDLPPTTLIAEAPPSTPPPTEAPPTGAAATEGAAAGEAAGAAAGEAGEKRDEQWWRNRMATAVQSLERNQVLADSLQSRVYAYDTDIVNRDDPAQRSKLMNDRIRALNELARVQRQIELDGAEIVKIKDEARRLGIPPGWVR
jgi:hypothetical protein